MATWRFGLVGKEADTMDYFNIKQMNDDELRTLAAAINSEIQERKVERREELIANACNAMNQLAKEFPLVELRMSFQCPECTLDEDFDVMEYFCHGKQMVPGDFTVY